MQYVEIPRSYLQEQLQETTLRFLLAFLPLKSLRGHLFDPLLTVHLIRVHAFENPVKRRAINEIDHRLWIPCFTSRLKHMSYLGSQYTFIADAKPHKKYQ